MQRIAEIGGGFTAVRADDLELTPGKVSATADGMVVNRAVFLHQHLGIADSAEGRGFMLVMIEHVWVERQTEMTAYTREDIDGIRD